MPLSPVWEWQRQEDLVSIGSSRGLGIHSETLSQNRKQDQRPSWRSVLFTGQGWCRCDPWLEMWFSNHIKACFECARDLGFHSPN